MTSLLARAVNHLSRREYSEHELRQKLAPYSSDEHELDQVIDKLKKEKWLSDERFAQSFIRSRAHKWGTQRVLRELRQHHPENIDIEALREELNETELDRAKEVWLKKFKGIPASTPKESAKQIRFMVSRGFSLDTIFLIIRQSHEDHTY